MPLHAEKGKTHVVGDNTNSQDGDAPVREGPTRRRLHSAAKGGTNYIGAYIALPQEVLII